MKKGEQYYTVKDIARQLRVSQRTVKNYIHAGLLGWIRFTPRGPYRISDSALERFLQAHTKKVRS